MFVTNIFIHECFCFMIFNFYVSKESDIFFTVQNWNYFLMTLKQIRNLADEIPLYPEEYFIYIFIYLFIFIFILFYLTYILFYFYVIWKI